jgi:hypothetical protein
MRKLLSSLFFIIFLTGFPLTYCQPTELLKETCSVPLWINLPELDGVLNDTIYNYSASLPLNLRSVNVRLYHSGYDLYMAIGGLPRRTAEKVSLLIDQNLSRDGLVQHGDFKIEVGKDGEPTLFGGTSENRWEVIPHEFSDIEAVAIASENLWNLEVRVSLEWLAGYGHTVGFALLIEGANDEPIVHWPEISHRMRPLTWGNLNLEPIAMKDKLSGSVFLDGAGGYVSIPYTEALQATDLTIECWVRLGNAFQGSLIGAGFSSGSWLGFNQVLQWQSKLKNFNLQGPILQDNEWHHLAITVEENGESIMFIDGARQYTRIVFKDSINTEIEEAKGLPWRLGSDRESPKELESLHAYLRDLRIWTYARTQDEIRRFAFTPTPPDQPGLAHWWPFQGSLKDMVGNSHAGQIGNAALAREAPTIAQFPELELEKHFVPLPDPVKAPPIWNNSISIKDTRPVIDGISGLEEYNDVSALPLDSLFTDFKSFLGPDGLYFASNMVPGHQRFGDEIILFINSDGQGGRRPGPNDLRLQLSPEAPLIASKGNGREFLPVALSKVLYRAIHGDTVPLQDNDEILNMPWWSGELLLGNELIAPFVSGRQLRLAVKYQFTIPANRKMGIRNDTIVSGIWPEHADPLVPESWELLKAKDVANEVDIDVPPEVLLSTPFCPSPRSAPTKKDYSDVCNLKFPANALYGLTKNKKWPQVDGPCYSFVRAEGKLTSIGISEEDAPPIHTSHDVDMHINVYPGYEWLVVNGQKDLVLETESAYFDRRAFPNVGDHVTVYGRWIFDCGHSPKTEIQPIPVFASDRLEYRPALSDELYKEVTVIRIWITKNTGTYFYTNLEKGTYEFTAQLPAKFSNTILIPFVRMIDGVSNTFDSANFTISGNLIKIELIEPKSGYYEFIAGYLNTGEINRPAYTISMPKIKIKDDHDNWPNGEGEWYMFANINDNWHTIFWDKDVDEDESYSTGIKPVIATDAALRLQVIGYEDDDGQVNNYDGKGEKITEIREGYWNLGLLSDIAKKNWNSRSTSDWVLDYKVVKGGSVTPIFDNPDFWTPRMKDEKPYPVYIGKIAVPAFGAPSIQKTISSYLLQDLKVRADNTKLLAKDLEDQFSFGLADPADVEITVTPNAKVEVTNLGNWLYSVPENLNQMFGYSGATVKITAKNPNVENLDFVYGMTVKTKYRVMPPDWGEDMDNDGGRLIDLRTPAPNTLPSTNPDAPYREIYADWAWQHVPGDVDIYKVIVPIPQVHPTGGEVSPIGCKYDHYDELEISAPDMEILVPAAGSSGKAKNYLKFKRLHMNFRMA